MLESRGLCIGPWTRLAPAESDSRFRGAAAGPTRTVRDAASAAYLGFVRPQPSAGGWWRRWRRHRVEVLEDPDASLLLVVRRGWGWPRRWEVLDADGHRVGTFRSGRFPWSPETARLWRLGTPVSRRRPSYSGTLIEDWFGRIVAWIEDPSTHEAARLIAPDGQVLGTVTRAGPETVVEFGADLEGKPFAKMAVLAALLDCENMPPV